ncbi:MAG: aminotransferase class I/II-fold pyridoxal phosphate-dependent enzyme [Paracoccaceae bacterium]|jgi:arginine:pyruvate transaminase|nr:aminotransferase class I/II-fold pyridoxal phosphate-dependent enzyme [Paracoccaceae bacterium]
MKISNRLLNILGDGSDGWDIFRKAADMVRDGIDVTQLTIGEHDIRTDQRILDAMHQATLEGHTGYAAIPGIFELRQAVAERVQAQTGEKTTYANVLITPGGQSALFAAHIAACNPGDRAMYIDPYYATYPGTIRGASAVPVPVKARAEAGFQPDAADLAAQAKNATSLLINSPNNPTGVVYSRDTLEGIATLCQTHDLWLISDEVYDTQIWQGRHITPRSLEGMRERTLVVGSMSKSHAMTGSRIGWLIGPEEVVAHLMNLSTHTTYGVAGFVQQAALSALKLGIGFEQEIAQPFRRRREIAIRCIEQSNVVGMIPPQGAMYMMLDIRNTGMSGDEFANALLEKHHIAVMPGESFGDAAAGHLRVALTVDDQRLEQALKTLVRFAEENTR